VHDLTTDMSKIFEQLVLISRDSDATSVLLASAGLIT